MIKNQIYTHYKKNDYKFLGIALPYNETLLNQLNSDEKKSFFASDAEFSTDEVILGSEVFVVGDFYMTLKKEEHVVYEALKEGSNPKIWIRPFNDFFSKVEVDGEQVDRFSRKG